MLCSEILSYYHARRHNDLGGHSSFSSTIFSFSILCLEHYYCEDQQWRSLYLKVKSAKCLWLLPVVLVLLLWSWSWSEEFGLVYITVGHYDYTC